MSTTIPLDSDPLLCGGLYAAFPLALQESVRAFVDEIGNNGIGLSSDSP